MNGTMYALGRKLALALAAALVLGACELEPDTYDSYNYEPTPDPVPEYTLTFMSMGGSAVEPIPKVKIGSTVSLPDPPLRGGYVFQGWYYDNGTFQIPFTASTALTSEHGVYGGGIRVYAKWTEDTSYSNGTLPEGSLNSKLRVIADRADKNTIYTIPISEDTSCEYWDIVTRGINVVIKIRSADPGNPKKLSSAHGDSLFGINNNITVVLEDIIIQGRADSNNSMIVVNSGTLELRQGAKLTGNRTDTAGGAVRVYAYGNLILEGGEISGNASTNWGGGVVVMDKGTFTMNSGLIRGNRAGTAESTWSTAWGGGVGVYRGKFLMTGGEISGNTAVVGGGVGIYGTGFNRLDSQFVKTPVFASTVSGIIYGADGPEGKKNTATINAANKYAAVAYHDGKPYGDITYRTNTIDSSTGISTNILNAVWNETIREYNL
jgi:uncharacterized repeat protein (TIGR02543 family)